MGGARIWLEGGKHRKMVHVKSCTAMASQKFRFGGKDIQQKCTHQRLLKNLYKHLHKNLINSLKCFKIKI